VALVRLVGVWIFSLQLLLTSPPIFGDQRLTFETRGKAVIMRYGAITIGVEKRDIDVPSYIDAKESQWRGMEYGSDKGWTKCRVPMKSDFTLQGPIERSLVFDCRLVR
jgi:hypothetical protein